MGTPPLRLPSGPELQTAQRLNASISHLSGLRAHWSQMPDRRKAQSLDITAAILADLRAGLQVSAKPARSFTSAVLNTLLCVLATGVAAGWLVGFHHGQSQAPVPSLARVGP